MKLLMVRSSSTTRIKRFSLICFLLHGKAEAEDRSALRVISGGEEAAVGFDDALADGQADAHASGGVA